MRIEGNLNCNTKVQLTSFGKQVLKEYYPNIDMGNKVDENGWYENQFHMIITIFGPHMRGFSHLPIGMVYETEIDDGEWQELVGENDELTTKVDRQRWVIDVLEDENKELKQTIVNMAKEIHK